MSSLGSGELYAAIARLRQRFDQHRKRKLDDYALLSYPSAAAADSDDDDDQDSFPLLKMHKLGSSSSSPAVSDDHPSQLRPQHSSFSFPSSSSSTLHFFVRLMSRNTVVIHARPDDTVDSVIDQLQSITGIPTSEQRLLYRGRQLQGEATLASCAVENDASLQLTGRLRSTKYPRAWQIADDLIASICSLDTIGDDRVHATRTNVEGLIKRFLSLTGGIFETNREEVAAHLEVFTSSGAPSALVKLYLSPVHDNRLVATNAIKIFLHPNPEFLPEYIHVQCAPIVLKFCKILSGTVGKKDLQYIQCRSALASLLETAGGPRYLTHMKPLDIVLELLGFTSELTKLVLSGLSEEFMFIAQPVLDDLSNFLSAMRWAIQDWMGMEGPIARHLYNSKHPEYEDWIGSLHHLFIDLLKMVDQGLKKVEDCLNQEGLERCESFLTMWPDMVAVLSVANVFAKMFEDAQQLLHALLLVRRIPVNFLLKHAKRSDKLRWFLKYKDVTDFEARRNLVLMLLPEWKDEDELHEMLIDRSQLLAESFEYISQADPMALHGGLFLEFKNEEATGPGVLREWFCLLCQAIFNPQNVLFLPCPNDRRRFFPNPG
ncbi:putative E3 ubiquitin-protein ligase UPL5 [Cocos nucifera]|nr:putative E3 ubiquitin-protein ligase UPL5 [Cocos nucifera]